MLHKPKPGLLLCLTLITIGIGRFIHGQSVANPEIPSLDSLSANSYALELSAFVAKQGKHGAWRMDETNQELFFNSSIHSVDQRLQLLQSDTIIGTCLSNAILMHDILRKNGLTSYVFQFGIEGTEDFHAVVLLEYEGDLMLYDPTVTFHLTSTDNLGMESLGLIELLKGMLHNRVEIDYLSHPVTVPMRLHPQGFKKIKASKTFAECIPDSIAYEDLPDSIELCYPCDLSRECSLVNRVLDRLQEFQLEEYYWIFLFKPVPLVGHDSRRWDLRIKGFIRLLEEKMNIPFRDIANGS
jgi:hypothetical protein